MAIELRTMQVPVEFSGFVEVRVPVDMEDEDARLLAEKIALSRVLATVENPDAPDLDAFEDYEAECSDDGQESAEEDWDATDVVGVSGGWRSGEAEEVSGSSDESGAED